MKTNLRQLKTLIVAITSLMITWECTPTFAQPLPRVAVITTVWRHNSHADVLASRLVQGNTLDGQGEFPQLKLASAYVDQFPENDMSRRLAQEHGFPLFDSVDGALKLGGDGLAVDGVLLICEHGEYPRSEITRSSAS